MKKINKKSIIITFIHLLIVTAFPVISGSVSAQNIVEGTFPELANGHIKLKGYHGFDTYTIDSVKADEKGEFTLSFAKEDCGAGYILSENEKSYIVLLAENEYLQLSGESFELTESIQILNGKQNGLFKQYATEHPRREQCLSAWDYLEKIYRKDSLFAVHEVPKESIVREKKRIKAEDSLFLADLPKDSYVSYYLPVRKLVSSVSTIAQYRTEEIPATFAAFRNMDYTDPRLYKSGLLKDAIESHFWFIENSGRSLDSVYFEMQISIDLMLENLQAVEQKLNEIASHLFSFLEERSLHTVSEYLALKLLNDTTCTLTNELKAQLEGYRAMKKGNTAREIVFAGEIFAAGYKNENIPKKLSEVKSNYKVVVFGAGWCPQSPKELQEITLNYTTWKKHGVEVVFISLDEDKQTFTNLSQAFPFLSVCDYKKWDSQPVKDYYVFVTPTIYLLNNKHEIILKPKSVNHLVAWIDWYLVQGNM